VTIPHFVTIPMLLMHCGDALACDLEFGYTNISDGFRSQDFIMSTTLWEDLCRGEIHACS
jgi:hypothetical protein